MRTILAMTAASFVLVGCGSLGSSSGSSDGSSAEDTCQTIVTKTGVVEQC